MADKPTVLLVVGPGGMAFDEKEAKLAADNFKKTGADVVIIGDGKRNVSLEEVTKAAEGIKGQLIVFTYAHGEVKDGKHCVGLTEECNTPTKDFFSQITKVRDGKKFDVFMASCHGGAAQAAANEVLPKGSAFVDLAPGKQAVAGSDVTRFLETVAENKEFEASMSGEKMLHDYLMTDLKNRIPPSITIAGEGSYNLESILKEKIGQKFTEKEKERAHKTLDAAFGKEKVDASISKIESAKMKFGDMQGIYAVDFGPALAVAFAAHDRSKGGMQLPKDFKLPDMKLKDDEGLKPFDDGFNKNPSMRIQPEGGVRSFSK